MSFSHSDLLFRIRLGRVEVNDFTDAIKLLDQEKFVKDAEQKSEEKQPGSLYDGVLRSLPEDSEQLIERATSITNPYQTIVPGYLLLMAKLIEFNPEKAAHINVVGRVRGMNNALRQAKARENKLAFNDENRKPQIFLLDRNLVNAYVALEYQLKKNNFERLNLSFSLISMYDIPYIGIRNNLVEGDFPLDLDFFTQAWELIGFGDTAFKEFAKHKEYYANVIIALTDENKKNNYLTQIFTQPNSVLYKLFWAPNPSLVAIWGRKPSENKGQLGRLYPLYLQLKYQKLLGEDGSYEGIYYHLRTENLSEAELKFCRETYANDNLINCILEIANPQERLDSLKNILSDANNNIAKVTNKTQKSILVKELKRIEDDKLNDAEVLNFNPNCFVELIAQANANQITSEEAASQFYALSWKKNRYLCARGDRKRISDKLLIDYFHTKSVLLEKNLIDVNCINSLAEGLTNFWQRKLIEIYKSRFYSLEVDLARIRASYIEFNKFSYKVILFGSIESLIKNSLDNPNDIILEILLKRLIMEGNDRLTLEEERILPPLKEQLTNYILSVNTPHELRMKALQRFKDKASALGMFFDMDFAQSVIAKKCRNSLAKAEENLECKIYKEITNIHINNNINNQNIEVEPSAPVTNEIIEPISSNTCHLTMGEGNIKTIVPHSSPSQINNQSVSPEIEGEFNTDYLKLGENLSVVNKTNNINTITLIQSEVKTYDIEDGESESVVNSSYTLMAKTFNLQQPEAKILSPEKVSSPKIYSPETDEPGASIKVESPKSSIKPVEPPKSPIKQFDKPNVIKPKRPKKDKDQRKLLANAFYP